MKSRSLIEDVLFEEIINDRDSILMINQYIKTDFNLKEKWLKAGLYPVSKDRFYSQKLDSAIGRIYSDLKGKKLDILKKDKKLSFVNVSLEAHDQIFVKEFVSILASKSIESYINSKTRNSRINIEKLQRKADSVTLELDNAMNKAAKGLDKNLFVTSSEEKIPMMKEQMKISLLTTLYGELIKNLEYSKTIAAQEKPFITIIDTPHYPYLVKTSLKRSVIAGGLTGGFISVLLLVVIKLLKSIDLRRN